MGAAIVGIIEDEYIARFERQVLCLCFVDYRLDGKFDERRRAPMLGSRMQ